MDCSVRPERGEGGLSEFGKARGGGLAKIDIACAAFRQFQVPVDDVLCFVQNIHILHSASGLDVYIVAPSTYN